MCSVPSVVRAVAGRGTTRYHRLLPLSPATLSEVTRLAAYAIFLCSYLVFALGKFPGMKIDRPGAAIIGAVLMVAFRAVRPAALHRFRNDRAAVFDDAAGRLPASRRIFRLGDGVDRRANPAAASIARDHFFERR